MLNIIFELIIDLQYIIINIFLFRIKLLVPER